MSFSFAKQGTLAEGDILPELIWTDHQIHQDVHVLSIGKTHIVLKVDGMVHSISQEQFLTLYLTTRNTIELIKINQLAVDIGGGKPGSPSLKRIIPGFIFPKLLWTDGQTRDLVEILNTRQGYYIMRIDGQTRVLDKLNFLGILESTKQFLENGQQPMPALPQPLQPPVAQPVAIGNLPPPPPASPLPPPAPGKSGLEPPPQAKPGTQPLGQPPVYFDFQFEGDPQPPSSRPSPSQTPAHAQ